MSKDYSAVIAEMEAQGYFVTPPRDRQSEFEDSVGRWLQSFETCIQRPYERHEVVIRERSLLTLGYIHKQLGEMLDHAMQEEKAA